MKEIIDTKLRGWLRTIVWVLNPLIPIKIGKWYITFRIPRIIAFYETLDYVIKNTFRCYKYNKLIPSWQYASWTGSQGACCAHCAQK